MSMSSGNKSWYSLLAEVGPKVAAVVQNKTAHFILFANCSAGKGCFGFGQWPTEWDSRQPTLSLCCFIGSVGASRTGGLGVDGSS